MHIPSENDIIIPDPSFDIRDVMDFKLLSSPSPTATVQPSQPVSNRQFDSIQKFFSPSLSCLDVFYTVLYNLLIETFPRPVEGSFTRRHCHRGRDYFDTSDSAHSLVLHGSGGTFLSEMEERKPFRSHQRASYSWDDPTNQSRTRPMVSFALPPLERFVSRFSFPPRVLNYLFQ